MKAISFILLFHILCNISCLGQLREYKIKDFDNGISSVRIKKKKTNKEHYYTEGDTFSEDDVIYLKENQGFWYYETPNSEEHISYNLMRQVSTNSEKGKEMQMSIRDYKNKKDNNFSHRSSRRTHGSDEFPYNFVRNEEVVVPPDGSKRVALIIGNFDYQNSEWGDLPTCEYSTIEVARVLRSVGFNTIVIRNVIRDSLLDVVKEFNTYTEKHSTQFKLFYYTGHGKRSKGERDYIIPVDAKYGKHDEYVLVEEIANGMWHPSNNNITQYQLLFIDACRDIDTLFVEEKTVWKPNVGTAIMCSADEGQKSYPNINDNDVLTPFANAFIQHLGTSNVSLADIMRNIKKDVDDSTSQNARFRQIPSICVNNSDRWDVILSSSTDTTQNWRIYLGVGCSLLTHPAVVPCLNIGVSYKQWRFELGGAYNVKSDYSDDIFIYDSDKRLESSYKYKGDLRFFGKVGYNIPINKNFDIVPLLGVSLNRIGGEKIIESSSNIGKYATAASGTIDARIIWSPCKSRTVQFFGSIGFYGSSNFLKSDNYKSFEEYDNSNAIKKWATGVDFQIGVIWNIIKW